MTLALEGIRVIEVASYVTGPYAAALLGDLGADVLKIEEPERGDPFRGWGEGNYSPTFCGLNRNKRSVACDLRAPEGQRTLLQLADGADVLIENHRPGVAERLGFGYEAVAARNPRLIYCSITGFGSSGPYRDRPGYDTVGQAMSGLLSVLTNLEAPQPVGISLSDHLTGLFACYGILAALLARDRTGRGQRVDTSLLQATVAFMGENVARYFASRRVPRRATRTRLAQVYGFVAGDGRPFVVHLSSPRKFWEGLAHAVERADWIADGRYATREARQQHYDDLAAELSAIFASAPRDAWLERLGAHDVPCAPLNTLDEVFADPQVQHLGLRRSVEHPQKGRIDLVASAVSLSDTPATLRLAPPLLGEHTAEVVAALNRVTASEREAGAS